MTDRGAHYFACDFQVHTPRDGNWTGPDAVTDTERESFASDLVQACRERGLNAIAVTDHHDFTLFPYVRAAAAAEVDSEGEALDASDRLVVYPGLELTLGVPCQALLILDSDMPEDRLGLVLEALAVDAVPSEHPRLPSVVRIDHLQSLEDLYQALDARTWLRGRYIVLPNVTDGGHGTLMRRHMQAKYKGMPCVGGYLDGTVDGVGAGNRRIFDGLDQAWGNKKIALVQTSDSRSHVFDDLGQHRTWIKWARPTAEALRQACLAPESRIAHSSPALPQASVKSLRVSNSRFLGPVDLELNPQYNAIIGGRGTGKSTLLHYLRWALCDQPSTTGDDELADPRARQQRLVENTLIPYDASVDVVLAINGIEHTVRRVAKTGEVQLKVGSDAFRAVGEKEVRELLPVLAYSQKQLSSVAIRLDELTRFVTAGIQSELAAIDRDLDENAALVRRTFTDRQRRRQLEAAILQAELRGRSLDEQVKQLRSALVAVSEADRKTLDAKPLYDEVERTLDAWDAKVDRAAQIVERLVEVTAALGALDDVPEVDPQLAGDLVVQHSETSSLLELVARGAEDLRITFLARRAEVEASQGRQSLRDKLDEYSDTYSEVKARSAAHETQLTQLGALETEQREIKQTIERLQREADEASGSDEAHVRSRQTRVELVQRRSDLVAEQCALLSEQSGSLIRASLHRGQGLGAVAERLRAVVSGSGLRGAKVEGFVEMLRSESDPLATWNSVLDELDALVASDPSEPVTSERFPLLARLGFNVADIERIRAKLTPDGWLDLALVSLVDHPSFEYQVRDEDFIPFSDASAGQQATALLAVLLAQDGPPLIIDQPEDDLDSQIVIDVVSRIWDAKHRRQLVFSSHNANFVVNGDAELVVCCDYRSAGDQSGGRIKLEGAIDVPEVRDEITRVMEGGEKAFRLRKEKYGF